MRRAFIPKADGRQRPLGVASLEDKIVQGALVRVLNCIYGADFLGFSYGFRPGRSPHQALDALTVGIKTKKVNWVLDADPADFFGNYYAVPGNLKAVANFVRQLMRLWLLALRRRSQTSRMTWRRFALLVAR